MAIGGKEAKRLNQVADDKMLLNKDLNEHGVHYTHASSKLNIEKIDVSGDTATIQAKEAVTRTLNDGSKSPVYTKEEIEHTFIYSQEGNQWKLVEDNVSNPFISTLPEKGEPKVTEKPILLQGSRNHPSRDKFANNNTWLLSYFIKPVFAISGTYTPTNAVNYALSYWNNYNSAYRSYGNDCTNFVSQASNWGGWQHIGGWYDDPHYWWYSPNNIVEWGGRAEARSWINVQYYYFFARYSGRATNAQYLSDFTIGDTLQVDYGTPDGWLDHNTIVTRDDGNGNIYLTYHSNNTLNMSIWEFIHRTPGANYYGTLYNYYY